MHSTAVIIAVLIITGFTVRPSYISILSICFLTAVIMILCIILVIWLHIKLSSKHITLSGNDYSIKQIEDLRSNFLRDFNPSPTMKTSLSNTPVIFGRAVDSLLQQLIDFIIRDFIYIYLKDYACDSERLSERINEDIWSAIQILYDRFTKVDAVKLIACDILTKITNHFEKIREAKVFAFENNETPVFYLFPYVMCPNEELEYLRCASEMIIMLLLPRTYSLTPSKYFLREILTCKVFKPFIDLISDPDFFNRNIVHYIQSEQCANNIHLKAFQNAKSIEDMLRIIVKTDDVEALKHIRYKLVTKIMRATTSQNLNRSKGVDLDNDRGYLSSASITRTDINAAKKLKKYIGQLTMVKKECEQQLSNLGWEQAFQLNGQYNNKAMPISSILEQVIGRKYFSHYLATVASQDLIRYWTSVEELRMAHRSNWHQLGAEIFYTFIRNPTSEIKVDKGIKKRMEAFLLGDKGPDVFYEVQDQVVQTLEEKYYQSFIINDYYKEMLTAMEKDSDILGNDNKMDSEDKPIDTNAAIESTLNVGDHSNYAKLKLDQLEEKLTNKVQALQALRISLKPDSKILSKLENEVQWLEGERRQLEAHLIRTEIWSENLGKWRAVVQSAEVPDEREPPQFVLVVHMVENKIDGDESDSISTGWVVCRNLTQFQDLHRKLRPMRTDLRNLDLPSNTFKFLFGKTDKSTMDKAKYQIQRYLDFILNDDKLNQSEAVYAFLSPSSDHLKHTTTSPKKNRFFFSTLFKSTNEVESRNQLQCRENIDIDDSFDSVSLSSDTVDSICKSNGNIKSSFTKDTIAEPIYGLLTELFDINGLFKYIRKTLIGFVQVTYGRNINRQIHDTIAWWFSEQMIHYYMTLILKTFWPGGSLVYPNLNQSDKEKEETARKAYDLFIDNIPELLTILVGNNAAKSGARKVFETIQEKNLNKQLLYELLQIILDATFPELIN